jgi:hypothetical protein
MRVPADRGREQFPLERRLLERRHVLGIGGLGLVSCALPWASGCSGKSGHRPSGTTSTTLLTTDVSVLRLASSLEHYAVGLYGQAAALLHTPALVDAARYFSDQHVEHAGLFERATSDRGGQPFSTANAAVAAQLKQRVDNLSTEADFVTLAYDLESWVTATYFTAVGGFRDPRLDAAIMSVATVEARHSAVLGMMLSALPSAGPSSGSGPINASPANTPAFPAGGFQTGEGAIPPGTGV